MARPKTHRSPEALDATAAKIDEQALDEAGQALRQRGQQLSVIDMQFALDAPYDLHQIDLMMPAMLAMHRSSILWLGRALVLVKEHEPKGTFYAFLDKHGIPQRMARKYMQAAIKVQERPKLEELGAGKVLELLSEDDDTLDALEEGGTVAGLTLDEVDRMSVRELREALRAERKERDEEKAADEEIIRSKDERINKLMRDRRKGGPERQVRERAEELLRDADEAAVEATSAIARLRDLCTAVDELYEEAELTRDADVAERLIQNREWAIAQLQELVADLGE